jgi:diguanylate cyclase (GGDEF)-like protein
VKNATRFTAERIRKNIAGLNIPNNGARISITLSFGVAILNTTSCFDLDEILLCADKALYLAKEQGRNRVVPWEGEDQAPTIA